MPINHVFPSVTHLRFATAMFAVRSGAGDRILSMQGERLSVECHVDNAVRLKLMFANIHAMTTSEVANAYKAVENLTALIVDRV